MADISSWVKTQAKEAVAQKTRFRGSAPFTSSPRGGISDEDDDDEEGDSFAELPMKPLRSAKAIEREKLRSAINNHQTHTRQRRVSRMVGRQVRNAMLAAEEDEGDAPPESEDEVIVDAIPERERVEPEPMSKDDAQRTAYDLALAVAAGNHKTHFQLPPIDAGASVFHARTPPFSPLRCTQHLVHLSHSAPTALLPRGCTAANDYVPGRMPDRLLLCGSEDNAKSQWEATLAWRKEAGISTLLYTPQLRFDLMNLAYPSFFHGRDKDGDRVWYEQLGRVDVAALLAKGIVAEDVLLHKLFVAEYLWRAVEPNPDAQATTVLDVAGLKLGAFKGQGKSKFVKQYARLMASHYPQRTKRIVIINTPFFFPAMWKVASAFLPDETKSKVILMKEQKKKKKGRGSRGGGGASARPLEQFIAVEELPKCCASVKFLLSRCLLFVACW